MKMYKILTNYNKLHLQDAIFNILTGEVGRRFWEAGKRLVRDYFSWNEIVRKMERLYESLMDVRHL